MTDMHSYLDNVEDLLVELLGTHRTAEEFTYPAKSALEVVKARKALVIEQEETITALNKVIAELMSRTPYAL